MAFKPNYQQERGNRNRAKEQKKLEKLRRLQEGTAKRKGGDGEAENTQSETETETAAAAAEPKTE